MVRRTARTAHRATCFTTKWSPSTPERPGNYFGGITLFLFGVQMFTGLLLLLYYRPTVAEAFDSVRFIMIRVARITRRPNGRPIPSSGPYRFHRGACGHLRRPTLPATDAGCLRTARPMP